MERVSDRKYKYLTKELNLLETICGRALRSGGQEFLITPYTMLSYGWEGLWD